MSVKDDINKYISAQPETKRNDMKELHRLILEIKPASKLWFLDGKNADGKVVSNPNIGYGTQTMKHADGKTREFYQVGLSGNTAGISIYIMGIKDKNYLASTYSKKLGKASVTGYCIKFKSLKDLNTDTLKEVIHFGFDQQ